MESILKDEQGAEQEVDGSQRSVTSTCRRTNEVDRTNLSYETLIEADSDLLENLQPPSLEMLTNEIVNAGTQASVSPRHKDPCQGSLDTSPSYDKTQEICDATLLGDLQSSPAIVEISTEERHADTETRHPKEERETNFKELEASSDGTDEWETASEESVVLDREPCDPKEIKEDIGSNDQEIHSEKAGHHGSNTIMEKVGPPGQEMVNQDPEIFGHQSLNEDAGPQAQEKPNEEVGLHSLEIVSEETKPHVYEKVSEEKKSHETVSMEAEPHAHETVSKDIGLHSPETMNGREKVNEDAGLHSHETVSKVAGHYGEEMVSEDIGLHSHETMAEDRGLHDKERVNEDAEKHVHETVSDEAGPCGLDEKAEPRCHQNVGETACLHGHDTVRKDTEINFQEIVREEVEPRGHETVREKVEPHGHETVREEVEVYGHETVLKKLEPHRHEMVLEMLEPHGHETVMEKVEPHGHETVMEEVEPHGHETVMEEVEPHGHETVMEEVEPHGHETVREEVEPHGHETVREEVEPHGHETVREEVEPHEHETVREEVEPHGHEMVREEVEPHGHETVREEVEPHGHETVREEAEPHGHEMVREEVEPHGHETVREEVEPHGHETVREEVEPHGHETVREEVEPHGHETVREEVEPHAHEMVREEVEPHAHEMVREEVERHGHETFGEVVETHGHETVGEKVEPHEHEVVREEDEPHEHEVVKEEEVEPHGHEMVMAETLPFGIEMSSKEAEPGHVETDVREASLYNLETYDGNTRSCALDIVSEETELHSHVISNEESAGPLVHETVSHLNMYPNEKTELVRPLGNETVRDLTRPYESNVDQEVQDNETVGGLEGAEFDKECRTGLNKDIISAVPDQTWDGNIVMEYGGSSDDKKETLITECQNENEMNSVEKLQSVTEEIESEGVIKEPFSDGTQSDQERDPPKAQEVYRERINEEVSNDEGFETFHEDTKLKEIQEVYEGTDSQEMQDIYKETFTESTTLQETPDSEATHVLDITSEISERTKEIASEERIDIESSNQEGEMADIQAQMISNEDCESNDELYEASRVLEISSKHVLGIENLIETDVGPSEDLPYVLNQETLKTPVFIDEKSSSIEDTRNKLDVGSPPLMDEIQQVDYVEILQGIETHSIDPENIGSTDTQNEPYDNLRVDYNEESMVQVGITDGQRIGEPYLPLSEILIEQSNDSNDDFSTGLQNERLGGPEPHREETTTLEMSDSYSRPSLSHVDLSTQKVLRDELDNYKLDFFPITLKGIGIVSRNADELDLRSKSHDLMLQTIDTECIAEKETTKLPPEESIHQETILGDSHSATDLGQDTTTLSSESAKTTDKDLESIKHLRRQRSNTDPYLNRDQEEKLPSVSNSEGSSRGRLRSVTPPCDKFTSSYTPTSTNTLEQTPTSIFYTTPDEKEISHRAKEHTFFPTQIFNPMLLLGHTQESGFYQKANIRQGKIENPSHDREEDPVFLHVQNPESIDSEPKISTEEPSNIKTMLHPSSGPVWLPPQPTRYAGGINDIRSLQSQENPLMRRATIRHKKSNVGAKPTTKRFSNPNLPTIPQRDDPMGPITRNLPRVQPMNISKIQISSRQRQLPLQQKISEETGQSRGSSSMATVREEGPHTIKEEPPNTPESVLLRGSRSKTAAPSSESSQSIHRRYSTFINSSNLLYQEYSDVALNQEIQRQKPGNSPAEDIQPSSPRARRRVLSSQESYLQRLSISSADSLWQDIPKIRDSVTFLSMTREEQKLQELIRDCNESVQRMKDTEELILLNQKIQFECKIFPLISQSRRLVKHGEVTALEYNSKWKVSTRPVYLHLFNDCLLLSRVREGGRFVVFDHASDFRVERCEIKLHSNQKNIFRVFLNDSAAMGRDSYHDLRETEFIFRTETQSQKLRWICALSPPKEEINFLRDHGRSQMQCLKSYKARENDELSLEKADILMITQNSDDGWLRGIRLSDQQSGWFPQCNVQPISRNACIRNLQEEERLQTARAKLQPTGAKGH
ncbi:uncharacterized protein ACNLHF_020925 [Anomaloglossus baeobatrachus]|uniref:uncharacterized protein LOC142312562 n=1 Tax=Anomaloglossus baeobatrachus TaxID=238106 RepID=UPI003F4FE7B9